MRRTIHSLIIFLLLSSPFAGALPVTAQTESLDDSKSTPLLTNDPLQNELPTPEVEMVAAEETTDSTDTPESAMSEDEDPTDTSAVSDTATTATVNETPRLTTFAEETVWSVGSASELTAHLRNSDRKHFLLTSDINFGRTGFALRDGMVIDGGGHSIYYTTTSTTRGFYTNVENATIAFKNLTVTSSATGDYGLLTCNSKNVTVIYENVTYQSNSPMIYNLGGTQIFRGENTITQASASSAWAKSSHFEFENGKTNITYMTSALMGNFIQEGSSNASQLIDDRFKLIVHEAAQLNIQTSAALAYGAGGSGNISSYDFVVKPQGQLIINKNYSLNGMPKDYFFVNPSSSLTFDFQEESNVNMLLPYGISVGAAVGQMYLGKNSDVTLEATKANLFAVGGTGTFQLILDHVKNATFILPDESYFSLGLNSENGFANFHFSQPYLQGIELYDSREDTEPAILLKKDDASLNVAIDTFSSVSGATFTDEELEQLGSASKLVFTPAKEAPTDCQLVIEDVSATTMDVSGTAQHNGSKATQVDFYIFSDFEKVGQPLSAQYIHLLPASEFEETTGQGSYQTRITGLNPNTTYWIQMAVANEVGQSELTEPQQFHTEPALVDLTAEGACYSAEVTGLLASDTGMWINYIDGGVYNRADYGGVYERVIIEYSLAADFTSETVYEQEATLSGAKNQAFSAKLTEGITADQTYYVRVRALGVSGHFVTLSMDPVTTFQTEVEMIDVEVPLQMDFYTKNSDLNTVNQGKIYSADYQLVNKGNVPTKVTLVDLAVQNEAAQQLQLLPALVPNLQAPALALTLQTNGLNASQHFLTTQLSQQIISLEVLAVGAEQAIDLGGYYYAADQAVIHPSYQLTLKFERSME